MSSQIIYLTKTTECDKIEKLVTLKGEVKKKAVCERVHKLFT